MNSTRSIFTRMLVDGIIYPQLQKYLGEPAVFDDNAPDDLTYTGLVVVIAPPSRNEPADTFDGPGRDIQQDVRIYAPQTGDNEEIDRVALHLVRLFHNKPDAMELLGGVVDTITASGPVAAPTTDPSLVGRRITLRLTTKDNQLWCQ